MSYKNIRTAEIDCLDCIPVNQLNENTIYTLKDGTNWIWRGHCLGWDELGKSNVELNPTELLVETMDIGVGLHTNYNPVNAIIFGETNGNLNSIYFNDLDKQLNIIQPNNVTNFTSTQLDVWSNRITLELENGSFEVIISLTLLENYLNEVFNNLLNEIAENKTLIDNNYWDLKSQIANTETIFNEHFTTVGERIDHLTEKILEISDKIADDTDFKNLVKQVEDIDAYVNLISENMYVREEVDGLLNNKQDKLIAGDNITIDENNVISSTASGSGGNGFLGQWNEITDDVMFLENAIPNWGRWRVEGKRCYIEISFINNKDITTDEVGRYFLPVLHNRENILPAPDDEMLHGGGAFIFGNGIVQGNPELKSVICLFDITSCELSVETPFPMTVGDGYYMLNVSYPIL